jgi:hypothetical protein
VLRLLNHSHPAIDKLILGSTRRVMHLTREPPLPLLGSLQ